MTPLPESETGAVAAEQAEKAAADPQGEHDAAFAAAFDKFDEGLPGDDPAPDDGPAEPEEPTVGELDSRAELETPVEGESATPEAGDTYERALLALRYAHGKSADYIIKNASREELIALGTEAAARRAKTEAALEERATRIRELEEGTKAPAEPAKAAAVDWTPHLKALADTLGLDPEAAKQAFGPMLDAVAQQVRSEFDGRLSKSEQAGQEARAAEGRRQIGEQVRRLSEAHPKLKTDQDLVTKLNGKALALWKSGEYSDPASVYDDAAKIVLGASTAHLAAKRRNGSAPPPEGRVEDRTESSEDAFLKTLERVEAGDLRGARRVGSQVSWLQNDRRAQKK
jgi:hypothetical protein